MTWQLFSNKEMINKTAFGIACFSLVKTCLADSSTGIHHDPLLSPAVAAGLSYTFVAAIGLIFVGLAAYGIHDHCKRKKESVNNGEVRRQADVDLDDLEDPTIRAESRNSSFVPSYGSTRSS